MLIRFIIFFLIYLIWFRSVILIAGFKIFSISKNLSKEQHIHKKALNTLYLALLEFEKHTLHQN